jgi:hypothetical protein
MNQRSIYLIALLISLSCAQNMTMSLSSVKNVLSDKGHKVLQTVDPDSIKKIIVDTIAQSYIITYKGSFYGYGNKHFFKLKYNSCVEGDFIRTNDIEGNNDFIFLTVVTGRICLKEEQGKFILPMSEKNDYEYFENVQAVDLSTNIIAYFSIFDKNGNSNSFPLHLLNLNTRKEQMLGISFDKDCAGENINSVKILDKKVIIEYYTKENILQKFETAISI